MNSAISHARFLDRLMEMLGSEGWIAAEDGQRYFEDLRDRYQGQGLIILRPKSTEEVSQIVRDCAAAHVGIIPFGGGTGGSAGHINITDRPVVVLSLERMNKIRSVNAADEAIISEAGVILADIQAAADTVGRRFGLSLASEGSCTIGGNLASNAGGVQVLRYGNSRDLCLGIEAVLPDGSILNDLQPLRKDNTGYNLRHLLVGSEGTLGIITAATLKLSPRPSEDVTVMFAISSPEAALAMLHRIRGSLGDVVTGFELMSRLGIDLALKHFPKMRDPFDQDHTWYALALIEGPEGIRSALEEELGNAFTENAILDAVIAESSAQSKALWELRELAFEYNRKEGAIVSSDTSVPLSRIGSFVTNSQRAIADVHPGLRVNCYGHIGDGNIHVNVFPPTEKTRTQFVSEDRQKVDAVRTIINEETHACGGSISAEHGIGRSRIADLNIYGDPAKLALLRQIKLAIDPQNIMNPGALFID